MPDLEIDPKTAERMGYEGIVAAQRFDSAHEWVEVCLIAPGEISAEEYCIATHYNCDPDRPHLGSAGMNDGGRTIEEAAVAYEAACTEARGYLGLAHPGL